jgi:hypothetical protein
VRTEPSGFSRGRQVFAHGGVVPIGKVGDEVKERAAQLDGIVEEGALLSGLLEPLPAFRAEKLLAVVRSPREHFPSGCVNEGW